MTSEDSGYAFINTPPNAADESFETTPEDFEAAPETKKEQEEEKLHVHACRPELASTEVARAN